MFGVRFCVLIGTVAWVISGGCFSCKGDQVASCGKYEKHTCAENSRIIVFLKPLYGAKSDTHGVVTCELSPHKEGEKNSSSIYAYKLEGVEKGAQYKFYIHEFGDLSSVAELSYGKNFDYLADKTIDSSLLFDVQLGESESSAWGKKTLENGKIVHGFCDLRGRSLVVLKNEKPVMIGVFGLINPNTKI